MAAESADLIGPDDVAFTLDLTPAQLKIVHAGLRSLLSDFGHDQADVHRVIHEVLAKLPDEASIRAIDIGAGR
ncbi:MAG TPA: hypothetical protein VFG79_05425 [Solirubrobacter sp.]|jgi:hypothetical protein|nr:hypothetical protein [Solirubrobacter sp.]